jgi:hypothetical protein
LVSWDQKKLGKKKSLSTFSREKNIWNIQIIQTDSNFFENILREKILWENQW